MRDVRVHPFAFTAIPRNVTIGFVLRFQYWNIEVDITFMIMTMNCFKKNYSRNKIATEKRAKEQ